MYTRVLSCFHDPTSGSRLLLHLTQSTGSKNVAEIYVQVSQIYKNISIFIEIADKMFSLFLNLRLSLWDIYNGNMFAGYWVCPASLALCTWWKVGARGRTTPGEGLKPFASSHLGMSTSFWVRLGMKRTKRVQDVSPGPQSLGFFRLLFPVRTKRKEGQNMGGGSIKGGAQETGAVSSGRVLHPVLLLAAGSSTDPRKFFFWAQGKECKPWRE